MNEIHYDPDKKIEWIEFIELYNANQWTVDLSGWTLQEGVEFQIPDQTYLASGDYLVIAQDPVAVAEKYDVPSSQLVGPFRGRLENEGEKILLVNAQGEEQDRVEYKLGFPWPTVGDPISDRKPGTSFSIQLVNQDFDNDLAGNWRSASPTPGKINNVFSYNPPTCIRQVKHSPKQPKSSQKVHISAKITDADGVASVHIEYQIVEPGRYISLNDAAYQAEWAQLPMRDDGNNQDAIAGDFVFTAQIPANVQKHRNVIRYRITVVDNLGQTLTVPYDDDPQPNFGYFVYDGVPPWTGAIRPGETPEVTYGSKLLSSIPVYHLITSKETTERATWLDQQESNEYSYLGTLVYDNKVYDHVRFRARGGVWRYAMGKNMWKFNMNRGHAFQARDNYGRPYKETWDKVNLGANIQQANYDHRGEQGMFESVGFDLFARAGIESPKTNFVHLRIIDEEHEDGRLNAAHPPLTNSGTQYDGDFWGLYLAVEQVDGRFLDRNGLPDGNLYKMEGGWGEIRNQSPHGVADASDLRAFMDGYKNSPTEQWWRRSVDLFRYFNYRSIVEGIHHYDIANGKNYYYYLNPKTEEWYQFPWDIDLSWADDMFGQGDDPFQQADIFEHDKIEIEYQNRQREICDLLFNPDQANQLIHEFASFIYNPNGKSFVDADRAMWDYHWVMSNRARMEDYISRANKAGQGEFYQIADTKDFPGMLDLMKDYVLKRYQWIHQQILEEDANIPRTPAIKPVSNGYALDRLRFEISDFADPNQNDAFAAVKWRIAEVEPFASPWSAAEMETYQPSRRSIQRNEKPRKYEIDALWESPRITTFNKQMQIPPGKLIAGHTYRVRAKMQDNTGQWSHWSAPIQFVAEESVTRQTAKENLRITELMYNPSQGQEYEYIELHNINPASELALGGFAFTNGIEFTFPAGTNIPPNGYLLLTSSINEQEKAAFRQFYGLDETTPILGPYIGRFDNGGETVTLRNAAGGNVMINFAYNDGRGWPPHADGAGHSLVPLASAITAEVEGALDYGGHWRASTYLGGSPGRANPDPIPTLRLNEFSATNTLGNDWIEIHNPTSNIISLSNWYLSDDGDTLKKWPIPAFDMRPGQYISFDAETGFNSNDMGFGLNSNGEQIFLSHFAGEGHNRVADSVSFKAQEVNVSWGRNAAYPSYWTSNPMTRDMENQLAESAIVIDEIMYHPVENVGLLDANFGEFLELYNPSAETIEFRSPFGPWRMDGGIEFTFPQNIKLAPQERLLLVPFDPQNALLVETFFTLYPKHDRSVLMLGPYEGRLSNRGERIAVEKLMDLDPRDGSMAWAIVDEVIYFDQSPWPSSADGNGKSLQRLNPWHAGNAPQNWIPSSPQPGQKNPIETSVVKWMMY